MKRASALFALALSSIALIACGSSGSSSSSTSTSSSAATGGGTSSGGGGGGQTLNLTADPTGQLHYTTKKLTAKKAGPLTIDFNNPAAISHDVAVKDSSGKQLGVSNLISQSKTTLSVNLKPGKYTFYCTVPGHEMAGMRGTLTVK